MNARLSQTVVWLTGPAACSSSCPAGVFLRKEGVRGPGGRQAFPPFSSVDTTASQTHPHHKRHGGETLGITWVCTTPSQADSERAFSDVRNHKERDLHIKICATRFRRKPRKSIQSESESNPESNSGRHGVSSSTDHSSNLGPRGDHSP